MGYNAWKWTLATYTSKLASLKQNRGAELTQSQHSTLWKMWFYSNGFHLFGVILAKYSNNFGSQFELMKHIWSENQFLFNIYVLQCLDVDFGLFVRLPNKKYAV